MTGEEIHLNDALERSRLRSGRVRSRRIHRAASGEPPYHFVFPAHAPDARRDQRRCSSASSAHAPTDDPEELTMIARRVLRRAVHQGRHRHQRRELRHRRDGDDFDHRKRRQRAADDARCRAFTSRCSGIEKVLPRMEDLALFLPLLATAGTGQPLTGYNSLYGGPRQPGESDGPEELHVVLLDNGRTRLLADAEQRDALHCIRCGACLNVCPIYQERRRPHLRHDLPGADRLGHHAALARAAGLEASVGCVVALRRVHGGLPGEDRSASSPAAQPPQRTEAFRERMLFRLFAFVMKRPRLFEMVVRFARELQPLRLPAWTRTRELPRIAQRIVSRLLEHSVVMIDERANILARIREALQVPAPWPVAPSGSPRDWLPHVEDCETLFRTNASDLRGVSYDRHSRRVAAHFACDGLELASPHTVDS